MEGQVINRVAKSPLISINLEEYYHPGERVEYDLKQNLFQELILREKDFRAFVKENDWSQYQNKNVAILCSADAIVPTWAFMLIASKLEPFANMITFGSLEELETALFKEAIAKINIEELKDRMVVIKGCSDLPVPISAYVELTRKIRPVVKSIMFGEPCSTVPIYKKPKPKA